MIKNLELADELRVREMRPDYEVMGEAANRITELHFQVQQRGHILRQIFNCRAAEEGLIDQSLLTTIAVELRLQKP